MRSLSHKVERVQAPAVRQRANHPELADDRQAVTVKRQVRPGRFFQRERHGLPSILERGKEPLVHLLGFGKRGSLVFRQQAEFSKLFRHRLEIPQGLFLRPAAGPAGCYYVAQP